MEDASGRTSAVSRVLAFVVTYRVRLAAAAVFLIVSVFIWNASPADQTLTTLFLGPLAVGALVPLASHQPLSTAVNRWDEYFTKSLERARARETKLARYFLRPFHQGNVALWSASERIADLNIRAGVRLAVALYFWALTIALLIVAAYILIAIVIIFVILLIIGWYLSSTSNGGTTTTYRSVPSRFKGTVSKGTSALTQTRAGRVDARGTIYEGASTLTEKRVGCVGEDGTLYAGGSSLTEKRVGKIGEDGKIYKGGSSLTDQRVGKISEDGTISEGGSALTDKRVGKIDQE